MIRPGRVCLAWLLAAGLLSGAISGQESPGFGLQRQRLVDLHIRPLVTAWARTGNVPAGVVTLVAGDQQLILEGFGRQSLESSRAVDPATTLFQTGALARLMTATAILRLADRGLLELDADLADRSALSFLDLGSSHPLTLRQLLLHTAGFDQRWIASRSLTPAGLQPLATYLQRYMPPRIRPPDRVSIPSPHGISLAGLLLELTTDQDFATALETWVFEPFGMPASAVEPRLADSAHLTTGYRRGGSEFIAVAPDYPHTIPASFLLTTARDMSRWLQVVLASAGHEDSSLLSRESRELMLLGQFRPHPSLPGRSICLREGVRFSPPELYLAARGGGFSSLVMLLPARKVGIFAAANAEVELWDLAYAILETFEPTISTLPPAAANPETGIGSFEGYWQDASVPRSTADSLVSLVRQQRILAAEDGSLRWRSRQYRAAGPDQYREVGGSGLLCFAGGDRRPDFAWTLGEVLERLSWFRILPIQACLWIVFAAVFLAIGWPRPALPPRHAGLTPDDAFLPRWPGQVVRLAATLHFLFIAAVAVLAATTLRWQKPDLIHGVPASVYLVLLLPLIGAALTAVAVVGLVRAWLSPRWSRHRVSTLALSVLVLLLFLPFLWSWNLLGFHL